MKSLVPPHSSARFLETLAELSSDGFAVFDRSFRYLLWNPVMERVTGLSAESVIGKNAFTVFPYLAETGEDRLYHECLTGKRVSSKDRPYRVEGTKKSGHYDAFYAPWFTEDGSVGGGIAVIHDVTEAKHAREQIQETEQRFKNMADIAPVLLWMAGRDGLCTFFNQTWLDFTGRTLEEEWGVGWASNVHFEDFQRCMDTFVGSFNRREVFEMEYRLKRHDGAWRWILDRGTPRFMPDGSFAGYIGSCVDITERKQLEIELRTAVRARDEFMSIASHELRTPLAALQLQVERLVRALEKADPSTTESSTRMTKGAAAAALDRTMHLGKMVDTLLDIARIAEGRLTLDRASFDLSEVVSEVLERFQATAREARCDVTVVPATTPFVGTWDRFWIEQVMTNLLSNAIKYGAGRPVEIELTSAGDRVRVAVTDHGIGIAPEHQSGVFERFTRFASTRNYGGFGLGLWIARQVMQAHGGTIHLESCAGQGARFTIELPLDRPVGTESRPPENPSALAAM